MGHDTTKVLMGSTGSSVKEVTNHIGSPSTFPAGTAVRLKSDDTLSVTLAHGNLLGVSLGRSLSDTDRVAICRKGLMVPVALTAAFDPAIGAAVSISDTTGLAIAAGAGATVVNAVYATGRVGGTGVNGGITEAGSTVGVAYIDFPGGL